MVELLVGLPILDPSSARSFSLGRTQADALHPLLPSRRGHLSHNVLQCIQPTPLARAEIPSTAHQGGEEKILANTTLNPYYKASRLITCRRRGAATRSIILLAGPSLFADGAPSPIRRPLQQR